MKDHFNNSDTVTKSQFSFSHCSLLTKTQLPAILKITVYFNWLYTIRKIYFYMTTGIPRSKNFNYLFQKLSRSRFRSRFHLGLKEITYIQTKGIEVIKEHAYAFIQQRLAPAQPKNDGKQTPMSGHPVFIAQHATATCCRNCLKKWHAISKGQALRSNEIGYIVDVIMCWIKIQQKPYQSP